MSRSRMRPVALFGAMVMALSACGGDSEEPETTDAEAEDAAETDSEGGAEGDAEGDAEGGTDECNIVVNDDGSLEPLPDGFPDQPFTIVSADEPGAPDGIYGLAVKDAIESGLSDQRVTVVDRPDLGASFGAWEALGFIGEQPGGDEGYVWAIGTAPGSTTDLLQTSVMADQGVDVESMNVILTTEFVPYALVTRTDAPWGTDFTELIEYAQANPNELKLISRGPGAGLDLAFNHYGLVAARQAGLPEGESGIPVETVVGGSHQEINAIVGSGEGDIANTVMEVANQFHADGRVEVILFSGNGESPEAFSDVPTARDVFGEDLPNDPWGVNRFLFVPEGVPECHRLWLEELLRQVTESADFQENRANVPGLEMLALNREETWELANVAFESACEILKPMDLVHESVLEAGTC